MAENQVNPRLHDAHLVALEKAQDALEDALRDTDFDAAERINMEMRERFAGLAHVHADQIRQDLPRLSTIIGRHTQARNDLLEQVACLQRNQRRTQAVIAAYAKH
jgi:hypothetical protein